MSEPAAPTDTLRRAVEAAVPAWQLADEDFSPFTFAPRKRRPFRPRGRRPTHWSTFGLSPPAIEWQTKSALFPPLDQGDCNACTAFALAATMSDLMAIAGAGPAGLLSPGYVHQCVGGCACADGLDPGRAVSALRGRSVPRLQAGDYPYDPARCGVAQGVAKLAAATPIRSAMDAKIALRASPIYAVMELYEDFWQLYRGGVYRHVAGRWLASHSIEIVGYHDGLGCWLIKNSRGASWGMNGFAQVAYGECGIFTPDGNGGLQLRLS